MTGDLFERWYNAVAGWARSKHRELALIQMEPLDLAHSFIVDKHFHLQQIRDVSYVRRMFENYLIDCFRKSKKQRYVGPIDETTEYRREHSEPSTEDHLLGSPRELCRRLLAANLAKSEELLLELLIEHGTEYKVIADVLCKNEIAVRAAVSRLRRKAAKAEIDGDLRLHIGDVAGRLWTAYLRGMECENCSVLDQWEVPKRILEKYPESQVRRYFAEKSSELKPELRYKLSLLIAETEQGTARRSQALKDAADAASRLQEPRDRYLVHIAIAGLNIAFQSWGEGLPDLERALAHGPMNPSLEFGKLSTTVQKPAIRNLCVGLVLASRQGQAESVLRVSNLLWSTGLSELPLHDEWTANTLDLVRNCPTFSTDLKNVELPALDWMPSQILADPDTRRVLGKKMVQHVHQDYY